LIHIDIYKKLSQIDKTVSYCQEEYQRNTFNFKLQSHSKAMWTSRCESLLYNALVCM